MLLEKEEITKIVDGCVKNSAKAESTLYKIYYDLVQSVVSTYFKDEHTINDVTQNTFIKIFTNIDKYVNKGSFTGWVIRLTKNYCVDTKRLSKKSLIYSDSLLLFDREEDDLNFNMDDNNQKIKDIKDAAEGLSKRFKLVFECYFYYGMTHEEIASKLNISVNSSKTNLHRAKNNVFKKLKNKKYE